MRPSSKPSSAGRGLGLTESLQAATLAVLRAQGLEPDECQSSILRASASRPIVRYRVRCREVTSGAAIERVLIGKVHRRGDGGKAYAYMAQLWHGGFGAGQPLRVPEPVAYVEELRLLLEAEAEGILLAEHVDDPGVERHAVESIGRWLAKLHGSRMRGLPRIPATVEAVRLRAYGDALERASTGSRRRLRSLMEATIGSVVPLVAETPVPVHGDFQPRKIYVSTDAVTVIDFDRCGLAHPARDLGHFIAHSMTMSHTRTGSFNLSRPWIDGFLHGYANAAGRRALEDLAPFVARAFLEILHYRLVVRPVRDAGFVPTWLDECDRWLAHSPTTAPGP
jgi:hypothetical protein